MGRTAFRVYHGPSIYSHHPVIRCRPEVPGHLARDLDSIGKDLFTLLPGLRERHALCESALDRSSDGSSNGWISHLFEHIGLELQNLVGAELGCVRAGPTRIPSDDALIPFEDEAVGLEAGALALEFIESMGSARPPMDWSRRLRAFVRLGERERLPIQDRAMMRAAEARDIPVVRRAGRIIQLGYGRNQHRLSGTKTTHTNIVGNDLAA
ncbi:MAG: hypothetical protein ABIS67_09915, partial [Candidatus Eisenbacteria bacterium]